jgi:hypothetical protein
MSLFLRTLDHIPVYIMSDDPNVHSDIAKKVINMNVPYDVRYWTSKWNITSKQLKHAVDYVGPKEARVADYLRSKGIIRF